MITESLEFIDREELPIEDITLCPIGVIQLDDQPITVHPLPCLHRRSLDYRRPASHSVGTEELLVIDVEYQSRCVQCSRTLDSRFIPIDPEHATAPLGDRYRVAVRPTTDIEDGCAVVLREYATRRSTSHAVLAQ